MPIFSKENKHILFIHIPKTAGSSIEKLANRLGWVEYLSIRGKSLDELKHFKASLQHLDAQQLSTLLNFHEFDLIFTVVRHPFSRLKSEYYWQKTQKITELPAKHWIDHVFYEYKKNQFCYDNHIRPQIDFIPQHTETTILKLEQNAISKAQELFNNILNPKNMSFRTERAIKSIITGNKKDKASNKTAEIETTFFEYYDKIIDFYQEDMKHFDYE